MRSQMYLQNQSWGVLVFFKGFIFCEVFIYWNVLFSLMTAELEV